MKRYRRTTSCWLISQTLCFCLLLQGSGIAEASPRRGANGTSSLPPKKTFVSKSELESATALRPRTCWSVCVRTPDRTSKSGVAWGPSEGHDRTARNDDRFGELEGSPIRPQFRR